MKNILIVDDTIDNIEVLNGILKKEYSVQIALSGMEALEQVERRKPDIILLDVMMPEMDGFEVCKRLKANLSFRDIPVIFITALNDIFNEEHGFEVGAVDYLSKPVKPAIVRARIATHLKLTEQQRQLEEKNKKLEQMQRVLIGKLARTSIPEHMIKEELIKPQKKDDQEPFTDLFLDDHKNDLIEILEKADSVINLMILKKRFDNTECHDLQRLLYRFGTILNSYPHFAILGEAILNFSDVFGRIDPTAHEERKLEYIFEVLESFSFTLGRWAAQIFELKTDNPNIFDNSIISDIRTIEMLLENKDDEIDSEVEFF